MIRESPQSHAISGLVLGFMKSRPGTIIGGKFPVIPCSVNNREYSSNVLELRSKMISEIRRKCQISLIFLNESAGVPQCETRKSRAVLHRRTIVQAHLAPPRAVQS